MMMTCHSLHRICFDTLNQPRRAINHVLLPCQNLGDHNQWLISKVIKESDEVEENPLKKTCSEVEVMCDGIGSNGCCRHGSGWDSCNDGEDSRDSYYQKIINPNNALLLGNYARSLKEVVGDCRKAEEYLERAMLANPGDGYLLCLYAELIWQTEKNADRAEGYYDQAVQLAPHDCFAAASYAKFQWDAEKKTTKPKSGTINLMRSIHIH